MRIFDRYLPMSRKLQPVKFLLPLLFLMILIAFSNTTSVFGQSTAEVCRETQKVLQQYEREGEEIATLMVVKEEEKQLRSALSTLDKAIANGSLIAAGDLLGLLMKTGIERPSDSTGNEKQVARWTVEERRTLQRTVSSQLRREIEEAVNTTWDRLDDRSSKNYYQIQIRQQRMKDLNCAQLLSNEFADGENGKTSACWNGTFKGSDTGGYAMTINLTQDASGTVTGTWTFFHQARQTQVNAKIDSATVEGNTLKGSWTQTGVPMTGDFEWQWLTGRECKAFEGLFNGTKYWEEMKKQ